MNSLWKTLTNLTSRSGFIENAISAAFSPPKRFCALYKMHLKRMERLENPPPPKKKSILDGKPQARGIILKAVIKKPRKPNSANRKCVLVKLTTGKEMVAFVPGIGHALQEHQTVLCEVHRLRDTPGVKIRCVRGKYDLPHVKAKD